eukprot:CCRYP_002266-RA/>CCRYP_002266-RA protein AED:0.43 eAED:0.43 QI:13/1/1/1/0/0/2/140/184
MMSPPPRTLLLHIRRSMRRLPRRSRMIGHLPRSRIASTAPPRTAIVPSARSRIRPGGERREVRQGGRQRGSCGSLALFFVAVLAMIAIGAAAAARVGVAGIRHDERAFFFLRVFFAGRGSLRSAHYKVGIKDGVFFVVAHRYRRLIRRCRLCPLRRRHGPALRYESTSHFVPATVTRYTFSFVW